MVFPQLVTGASALYPVARKTLARTVINEMDDGRTVAYSDADGGRQEWELRATGLTENEWEAVEALFSQAKGRFETFTFLDPAGNLLARSEEFEDPVWINGALIQFTPGVVDPFGTTRATQVVNLGAAAQAVTQTLAVPGDYTYSLSAWARSASGASMTLAATAGAGNVAQVFGLSSQWRRYSFVVALGQASASVTFRMELAAGVTVELFGMQVEAQLGVSDYKKTAGQGGVFERARFGSDELVVRAQGTDVFDSVIEIVTVGV